MKIKQLELYTDYLISNGGGHATATGLSAMLDEEVKPTLRRIEREDGCLIFDCPLF